MRTAALVTFALLACGDDLPPGDDLVPLARVWQSDDLPGCTIASPLLVSSRGEAVLLAALADGTVTALSPADGSEVFRLTIPSPDGQVAHIAATPGLAGSRVVIPVMYLAGGERVAHQVVVLDLEARALDPAFPPVTLAASIPASDGSGPVEFLPSNAYSRSAVPVAHPAGSTHGLAYVSFGNLQDIQPWHGWVFELDLDAWSAGDDAIAGVLLVTPETECGEPGESGATDMVCGGGVWAPAGPILHEQDGDFELYIATGNGQLDLPRRDYANTVIRARRGLDFDPSCTACDEFDPIDPSGDCMTSCADLFIPRLLPGDPPFDPPDGRCDGKTFFECYAALDWDLGANSPARVPVPGGSDVLVVPAKDGGVYLVDSGHLGTLHDRIQLTTVCGANGGTCTANWAGTMVTVPAVTTVDETPVVVIPTFIFDETNPAGLVALAITRDATGTPRFTRLWEAPSFTSPEATRRFRGHVGRVALVTIAGEEHAALVDPGPEGSTDGLLYLVRVRDGAITTRAALAGPGRKYNLPAIQGETIFISSCDSEDTTSHLEAWSR